MARALIARAEERRRWIGDDHGDPYEQALDTGVIPVAMEIALKEIVEHLRSALDYCAREICESCGPVSSGRPIYFPIVPRGFDAKDFRSRVGKLMPGVMQARPDLLPIFASFQPFSATENGWLADLATLANETKHVSLSINSVSSQDVVISEKDNDTWHINIKSKHGSPFLRPSLKRLEPSKDVFGPGKIFYLSLSSINEEFLYFTRTAVPGLIHPLISSPREIRPTARC
jgi:hypothetical protein